MRDHALAAVYPGSFDPMHLGHVDIIRRAWEIFPRVIVAVLQNTDKAPLLAVSTRVDLIARSLADLPGVEVTSFSGLLVDFMRHSGARVILRGMRAVSDFEYEFQIALMNRRLWSEAETVFLTPNEEFTYLSSRVVKEIWQLGGDVSGLVPPPVHAALQALPR
ncbi:MAG: pantetheine-phosphate adenylyltransferase [Thermoanaerobaculaceae bacterium]|nr:pantetheine-phosphate adenylyltransferase [Thermoanaerobaculaceae bacterium]MDI9621208.1 pantetheine-phosphate adenylyltransferase [Acidobacteriota bacterium]NLH11436.1 pantetheine-phosphate adenylyltransferase [Holophagae bacterium]HPW55140.1 pantetheine-phosphate adenylyltransferase [Thermoanaerobaculaceae bacterium]